MKSRTLLTMFGAWLLASMAVPALAGHSFENSFEKQRRMTDGYTEPAAVPRLSPGAAGRAGKAPADTTWPEKQVKQTDGYTESAAVPASRPGAAGRPGTSTTRRSKGS